jgi:hypothetical protein
MQFNPPPVWGKAGFRLEGELHLRIQKQIVPALREWQRFFDRFAHESVRNLFRLQTLTGAEKCLRYIGADGTHLDYWLDHLRSAKLVTGVPAPDGVELVKTPEILPWLIERQWYGVFDAPKEFEEVRERWNETYTSVNGITFGYEDPLIGLARIDAHPIPTVEWQGRVAHTFAEITMNLCDDVADIVNQMRTERRYEHCTWDTLQRIATYKHDAFDGLNFDTLELNLQGEFRRMEAVIRPQNGMLKQFTKSDLQHIFGDEDFRTTKGRFAKQGKHFREINTKKVEVDTADLPAGWERK